MSKSLYLCAVVLFATMSAILFDRLGHTFRFAPPERTTMMFTAETKDGKKLVAYVKFLLYYGDRHCATEAFASANRRIMSTMTLSDVTAGSKDEYLGLRVSVYPELKKEVAGTAACNGTDSEVFSPNFFYDIEELS